MIYPNCPNRAVSGAEPVTLTILRRTEKKARLVSRNQPRVKELLKLRVRVYEPAPLRVIAREQRSSAKVRPIPPKSGEIATMAE